MKKFKVLSIILFFTLQLFIDPVVCFAGELQDTQVSQYSENNDRIDSTNDQITLNVGDTFSPENYAKAYIGTEEIAYGTNGFTAIVNEVNTSVAGTYTVVYRLENIYAGTYIDKTMTVVVENLIIDGSVTIQYQDVNGQTIAASITKNGNIGDKYTSEQLNILGYTFKEVIGDPSGYFTDTPQIITYIYVKKDVFVGEVIIKYQDVNGQAIAASITKNGNIGDKYTSEQLNILGYTFKEVIGDPSGYFTNIPQIITYIYVKNTTPIYPINQDSGGIYNQSKEKDNLQTITDRTLLGKEEETIVNQKKGDSTSTKAKESLPDTGEKYSTSLLFYGFLVIFLSMSFIVKKRYYNNR